MAAAAVVYDLSPEPDDMAGSHCLPPAKRPRLAKPAEGRLHLRRAPDRITTRASARFSTSLGGGVGKAADEEALQQLTAMGFPIHAAAQALADANGDVSVAADALAQNDEVELAAPFAQPEGAEAAASTADIEALKAPDADGEEEDDPLAEPTLSSALSSAVSPGVEALMALGFTQPVATNALAAAQGDVGLAAARLTEQAATPAQPSKPRQARRAAVNEATSTPPAMKPVKSVERHPLNALSRSVKEAVVKALAGPELDKTTSVHNSICRGRVGLRRHFWKDAADEARLAKLSDAYGKLKDYQRVAVRWLLALGQEGVGGILADEMGLGKTAVVLTFMDLYDKLYCEDGDAEDVQPSIVIVPASLLGNWMTEVRTWCPHFHPFKFHSASMKERTELVTDYFNNHHGSCRLILTTATLLNNKADRMMFFNQLAFRHMVCDEAHGLKNADTARFRCIDKFLKAEHRVLLTGTPVQNKLTELATLLQFILSKTHDARLDERSAKQRAKSRHAAIEELQDLVERGVLSTVQAKAAPFILRRLKKDVMKELPAKSGAVVTCPLTAAQKAHYETELATASRDLQAADSKAASRKASSFVNNLFARLRRTCNHLLLGQTRFDNKDYEQLVRLLCQVRPDFKKAKPERALQEVRGWSDWEVLQAAAEYNLGAKLQQALGSNSFTLQRRDLVEGSAKMGELLRILEKQRELKQKTLVFSQFTMFLDVIGTALENAGYRFARLDGGTHVDARPAIVQEFQDEKSGLDVFILSTKAGGMGLNLTAADTVVMMDLSFNPHDTRQAEDRVHRLGQTRPVTIHYLVCGGTIEEAVLKMNLDKLGLDYKFGGQRSILQDRRGISEDVDDDADDGQEAVEEEDDQDGGKRAEQAVMAELQRSLRC
eukprot:TRINITY_DN32187_c2_g1_i1.p1 TRINITY_DN32187_c2_g1~~TRINITY_DN32187_c2_g1_i1.p1  ORF type:complete len:925 (-),score=210.22 TRINITY_DN32187_c2_g1_i1:64-2733(-)